MSFGDDTLEPDWFQRYVDLSEAVRDLYYAAYWWPDRECAADDLWTNVKLAAGFPSGETLKRLGQPRPPIVHTIQKLDSF